MAHHIESKTSPNIKIILKPESAPGMDSLSSFKRPYTRFFRHDYNTYPTVEDFIAEREADVFSYFISGLSLAPKTKFTTDSEDYNKANSEYLKALNEFTPEFVKMIHFTTFEEGMPNRCSEQVDRFLKKNRITTYVWLAQVFSRYYDNPEVVAGILFTIALVDIPKEDSSLMPIVIAGLAHNNAASQEAALSVIEKWRSSECLKALQNVSIELPLIKEYAEELKAELEEEISDVN